MNRLKAWLRKWLGIEKSDLLHAEAFTNSAETQLTVLKRIEALEAELAQIKVDHYMPPSTPEPERKIIKAQTFRQYQDLRDAELEGELQDAIR